MRISSTAHSFFFPSLVLTRACRQLVHALCRDLDEFYTCIIHFQQSHLLLQRCERGQQVRSTGLATSTRAASTPASAARTRPASADSTSLIAKNQQLMVYIDSAGVTTATPFWYRVGTSSVTWTLADEADCANSAEFNFEMWCSMQDQLTDFMKFPKICAPSCRPLWLPSRNQSACRPLSTRN